MPIAPRTPVLVWMALGPVLACSDYGLEDRAPLPDAWDGSVGDAPTDGAAQIQVVPERFDFGQQATSCTEGGFPFWIRNVGDEPLDVLALSLDGGSLGLVLDVPAAPITLAPGDWVEGAATWAPQADGDPDGTLSVESTDPQAPLIDRILYGDACGDLDGDGLCDLDDPDLDGDGLPNADDEYPELVVVDDVEVGFDDVEVGTRIIDQYADLGVYFEGAGDPGEGGDSNVVQWGSDHTSATLSSPDKVLSTWVNSGFNHSGEPGLSGVLDRPADVVSLRMYTAGAAYTAEAGGEVDQATLTTYDADGNEVGRHTASADTTAGVESVVLEVMGDEVMSFALHTGDFDAIDDLRVLRLEEPACPP